VTQEKTDLVETPVYLPVGDDHVFAIATDPIGPPNGVGVILAMGGIYKFSLQRNRFQTRLARKLAARGYRVVSYDVHGTGESSGEVDRHELDAPFEEEADAAARWMESQGVEDIVFGASCAGGRACMKAAARMERVRAVALLSVPVVDYDNTIRLVKQVELMPASTIMKRASSWHGFSGLFDRKRRAQYVKAVFIRIQGVFRRRKKEWRLSENFSEPLARLFERKIPVLLAYGNEPMAGDFQAARKGALGKILGNAEDLAEIRIYPEHLHSFNTIQIQDKAAELVESWFGRVAPGDRKERSERSPANVK